MTITLRLCLIFALLLPSLARAIPEGPAYPSAAWTQREAANLAMTLQAPQEQVNNPAFVQRWITQSGANIQSYIARDAADPSWLLASSPLLTALLNAGTAPQNAAQAIQDAVTQIQQNPSAAVAPTLNTPLTPVCATWALQCAGDPFLYPGADPFYATEADVIPVVFYDDGCARLSGRVWVPKGSKAGAKLPNIVIETGSIEAPEPPYWWLAVALVRDGYAVLTFDVRGQGRSDLQTPGGAQGSDLGSGIFFSDLVNAIDFFRSSPAAPYPHNKTCAGTYPTAVAAFNPVYDRLDPDRLGLAGHSSGAIGVSVVQGYGAPGAAPWPGKLDAGNPVKVIAAFDGLLPPAGGPAGGSEGNLPVVEQILQAQDDSGLPNFGIRVPAMDEASEYGLTPAPFLQPPDPEGHKGAFDAWKKAGVPVFAFTIQGSTHFEWSLIPTLPTTSWCPQIVNGECSGGWG
ncbi:MAG: alpha/beta hydrolase family protein, partial [Stenotrophobium sp.]